MKSSRKSPDSLASQSGWRRSQVSVWRLEMLCEHGLVTVV